MQKATFGCGFLHFYCNASVLAGCREVRPALTFVGKLEAQG